jgi:hypothetical protein
VRDRPFNRDVLYDFHASSPRALDPWAHAQALGNAPATPNSVATPYITTSLGLRCWWRGITSWRSAANAPDEYQNACTILGAFVCCNGMLDRPPCTTTKCRETPGAYACHLPRAHRAGALRPTRRINRDRGCPPGAQRTGAGAWRPSGRINRDLVGLSACTPAHPALAHRAAVLEFMLPTPHSPGATSNTSVFDV